MMYHKSDIERKRMNWYSITAQCLTPIGNAENINETCGMYQQCQKGESLQDAIYHVMEKIAAPYRKARTMCAVLNYDKMTVTILDEQGHIVNLYWGFLGHKA